MAARRSAGGKGSGVGRLGLVLVLVAAAAVAATWWVLRGSHPERGAEADFAAVLTDLARGRGAAAADIEADVEIAKVDGIFVRTWRVRLAEPGAVESYLADVFAATREWDGAASAVSGDARAARVRLTFEHEAFDLSVTAAPAAAATPTPYLPPAQEPTPTPSPRPTLAAAARGKLAVILDDGGQSMDLVARAAALPPQVAVAILPFLPHSAETAGEVHRAGHEVWLHLPMEPGDYPVTKPGPGAIMVAMSEDEIRTATRAAVNNLPHLTGVNNHMGSRATTELRVMTWVMQELKARGLVFVDSRTHVDTVAELAARSQGVPCNRRHVFLDNERSPEAIRASLEEAVYRSRAEGEIIAIGHLVESTVQVLAAQLPTIGQRGVELVPPSALTR